jgi:hypothetical protein
MEFHKIGPRYLAFPRGIAWPKMLSDAGPRATSATAMTRANFGAAHLGSISQISFGSNLRINLKRVDCILLLFSAIESNDLFLKVLDKTVCPLRKDKNLSKMVLAEEEFQQKDT